MMDAICSLFGTMRSITPPTPIASAGSVGRSVATTARLRNGEGPMSLLLLPALALGFIASLIPFIYPVTLFNIPGVQLNLALGGLLATAVPVSLGILVGVAQGVAASR